MSFDMGFFDDLSLFFQVIAQKKQRKVRGSAIPICATIGSKQIGDEACPNCIPLL
jgi:hypothetical protein